MNCLRPSIDTKERNSRSRAAGVIVFAKVKKASTNDRSVAKSTGKRVTHSLHSHPLQKVSPGIRFPRSNLHSLTSEKAFVLMPFPRRRIEFPRQARSGGRRELAQVPLVALWVCFGARQAHELRASRKRSRVTCITSRLMSVCHLERGRSVNVMRSPSSWGGVENTSILAVSSDNGTSASRART